ncbi:MAG TPA: methylated-DNA--[protein]-cysteine S-methyltransferase [Gemmatimonadales bacterium]|nr:methylated-DNA--[protein]-cysteine S-methyltransferase [Gemmatimonadales bacterium]
MRYTNVPSPVGELLVAASDQGLSTIVFETWRHGPTDGDRASWEPDDGRGPAGEILAEARTQLGEYFARTRTTFDLPLDLSGTPFQLAVWQALRKIPYGSTISYGELARRVRSPSGSRAVGAANGRNPVVIVVPCHRVIGADGDLTGFGGGMERKRWLLEHEGGVKELFE